MALPRECFPFVVPLVSDLVVELLQGLLEVGLAELLLLGVVVLVLVEWYRWHCCWRSESEW